MSIAYHSMGKSTNPADWVISFSDACKLDPETGGHPKIFHDHMINPDQQESKPSMNNGTLLHAWIEHKSNFVMEELDKPGDKVALFCEALYGFFFKDQYKTDSNFAHYAQGTYSIDLGILAEFNSMYKRFKGQDPTEDDLKAFIFAFRYVREQIKYQARYGDDALIGDFKKNRGIEYLNFLLQANGKIIMTKSEKDIVTNSYEALREHPLANKLLFELEGQHEVELFWQSNGIKRKGKIDKLIVDEINRVITITDLKTTAYPVANFIKPDGSYNRYNYRGQLVTYTDGWFKSKNIQSNNWKIQLLNIVVQTIGNNPVMIFETISDLADIRKLTALENRIKYHIDSNNWTTTMEEKDGPIQIH